jgi:hypothetical protein
MSGLRARVLRRAWRVARHAAVALVALLAAVPPAGCNIVTPIAYLVGGLPKVDPIFVLEERKTVVFVDDRANVISSSGRSIRLTIAEAVTNEPGSPSPRRSPTS